MLAILQQIFPFAFPVVWFGGFAVLGIRAIIKHNAYMRTFQGIEWFVGDPVFIPASFRDYRAYWRAMLLRQSDPALEHLRGMMWRRILHYCLWVFGFPIVTFGVVGLLQVNGALR